MTSIHDLTQIQTQYLMKRIPPFELSYETIAHKKVFPSYNLGLAIPNGKKYYAYFSFQQQTDVCYLMEMNREKKITKVSTMDTLFDSELSLGTMLYGTLIPIDEHVDILQPYNGRSFFVIEDIFFYKGLSLKNIAFGEKLGYIEQMMQKYIIPQFASSKSMVFVLPILWGISDESHESIVAHFEKIKSDIPYLVHHIQIRKLGEIAPYLNIPTHNAMTKPVEPPLSIIKPNRIELLSYTVDYHKPQYKYPTVFQVTADIQFDIYHLFAYGKNKTPVYYGIAGIPTIEKSFFMNSLFRNIKENSNIDYIEESDDESDFENMAEDKYVDLNKIYNMECIFHMKFKKWIPVRIIHETNQIVHISKLVSDYIW